MINFNGVPLKPKVSRIWFSMYLVYEKCTVSYTHLYLMKKPGVTKDLKREWNWIRYMIGGKMFVAICLDGEENNKPYYITLKLEPMEGDFLRQQYEDIIPGYYCNKMHWNSINPDGCVPDDLLKDMIDKSYKLVLEGFSRKKQQEILLTTYCLSLIHI